MNLPCLLPKICCFWHYFLFTIRVPRRRRLTRLGLAIATVLMVGSVTRVQAVPIIYTLSSTASGTLGGASFTNAAVVITLTGDTANVTPGPAPYTDTLVNFGSATVTIAGVGTATFTDQIAILSTLTDTSLFGVPAVLIVDNTTNTGLLLQTGSVYTTYNLKSSLGPISGTGGVASGSHMTPIFATTAGNMTWTVGQS